MILAGLALLTVGGVDLVRQFVPRAWVGFSVLLAVVLLVGGFSDAWISAVVALVAGALWVWCMPDRGTSRASFWPALALAALCVGAVVWGGERADAGVLGAVWALSSPFGPISVDMAVLALGCAVFLLESGNLVVRSALDGEHSWTPKDITAGDVAGDGETHDGQGAAPAAVTTQRSAFQGGRLIGPLERIIVFLLTLAGAYSLLAAMLAAKGIVRFPEISRDGETGARAEYFLVGSLTSWVTALGAAFLVWWSANT